MKGTTLLLLGGGAVAVGVAVLYLRRQQGGQKPGDGTCVELLVASGVPRAAAELSCRATDVVGEVITPNHSKHNSELNGGPCKRPMDRELEQRYQSNGPGSPISRFPDSCVEYPNGCTPIKGSPGWAKCAPGTKEGAGPELIAGWARAGGVARYGQGSTHQDPTSVVKGVESQYFKCGVLGCSGAEPCTDPITGRPGQRGWLRGKATCCQGPNCVPSSSPRDTGTTGAGGEPDKDGRDDTRVVADRRGSGTSVKGTLVL